jgi:hypothetical protein
MTMLFAAALVPTVFDDLCFWGKADIRKCGGKVRF